MPKGDLLVRSVPPASLFLHAACSQKQAFGAQPIPAPVSQKESGIGFNILAESLVFRKMRGVRLAGSRDGIMTKRAAIVIFLIISAICVIHAFHYYPLLPNQVPSNFKMSGQPQSWTQKTEFMIVYLATVGVVALFFPILGLLLGKMPPKWINLPNKEYWLSPERKQETLDYMAWSTTWMGSGTLLFVMLMFDGCFQAALNPGNTTGNSITGALVGGGLYLLFLTVFCVAMVVRFRKKEI